VKRPPLPLLAAILVAGLILSGGKLPDLGKLLPKPAVVVPAVPVPSAELQGIVGPVKAEAAKLPAAERAAFARYFADFAAVLLPDLEIKSAGAVRQAIEESTKRSFGGDKYPAFNVAAEKAVMDALGADNVSLDEAKRKRLIQVFEALSWACQ
jgi:hypothetical protein